MTMKFYLLLILILGYFISCESPVTESIIDEQPSLSVILNDSTFSLGDTLQITIHASDFSLVETSLDFGDGTIVSLQVVNGNIDTTLNHIYNQEGEYLLAAAASDGKNVKKIQTKISVNDQPNVILEIGDTTPGLGDTLYVYVRVSDLTLESGFIDFGDGTIFSFQNLDTSFDTTVCNIYTSLGTHTLLVSFSDGVTTTVIQKNIQVSNNPPVIQIYTNHERVEIGDTVRVRVFASDFTLLSGYLNFGDGTIVQFSNLNHQLDTTLVHTYSNYGEFLIVANFNDGFLTNYRGKPIKVSHYYQLNLAIGMKWKFAHYYAFIVSIGGGENTRKYGIYDWEILSFSASDSSYIVQQIRVDTIYSNSGVFMIHDTTEFNIQVNYDRILISASLRGSPFLIPNHQFVETYPVPSGHMRFGLLYCTDIVGPSKYEYDSPTMYSISNETLTLIDFHIP